MKKTGGEIRLGMFHKFALVIIISGLAPMVILVTVLFRTMLEQYRQVVTDTYEQAVISVESRFDNMLTSYNTITKMPYYYNFSSNETAVNYMTFDNFRQIVYGIGYDPENMEERRKADMEAFLRNLMNTDMYIKSAHFVGQDLNGNEISFHVNVRNNYMGSKELFYKAVGREQLDKTSRKMMIYPIHKDTYISSSMPSDVFTVARNYYDLRGSIENMNYVGTLYLDIDAARITSLIDSVDFIRNEKLYITFEDQFCLYSNQPEAVGQYVDLNSMGQEKNGMVLQTESEEYGISTVVELDPQRAFAAIENLYRMMYLVIGISTLALVLGSIFFSRRLTRPLTEMMKQMKRVETGDFDINLKVEKNDEIGELSSRFNQMSAALKTYINKSYVAQIKQNEAELTALKSQIYPHFLYNTLEIIRMTALENEDHQVSSMIEALSEQIHYLIGPVEDLVPLEKEVDIVKKYIFLLNCRIQGNIQFEISGNGLDRIMVPKLILQPVVENAYVHGIKPKGGDRKNFYGDSPGKREAGNHYYGQRGGNG
ncbi:MAG TPA: histidine kinase [Candidatus Hungatella pullicola]|nr:histidine kinase [Candidatus Hungatella pullicola]